MHLWYIYIQFCVYHQAGGYSSNVYYSAFKLLMLHKTFKISTHFFNVRRNLVSKKKPITISIKLVIYVALLRFCFKLPFHIKTVLSLK